MALVVKATPSHLSKPWHHILRIWFIIEWVWLRADREFIGNNSIIYIIQGRARSKVHFTSNFTLPRHFTCKSKSKY